MHTSTETSARTDESAEKPCLRVVEAVAEADGVDPATLDPPLHTVVDPEALNRLFAETPAGTRRGTIRFTYRGHEVAVRSDGSVELL